MPRPWGPAHPSPERRQSQRRHSARPGADSLDTLTGDQPRRVFARPAAVRSAHPSLVSRGPAPPLVIAGQSSLDGPSRPVLFVVRVADGDQARRTTCARRAPSPSSPCGRRSFRPVPPLTGSNSIGTNGPRERGPYPAPERLVLDRMDVRRPARDAWCSANGSQSQRPTRDVGLEPARGNSLGRDA